MKYKIDMFYRDKKTQNVVIRGWVVDNYLNDPVELTIESESPVEKIILERENRRDLKKNYPGEVRLDSGFIIAAKLSDLSGKITLNFKSKLEEKSITLNLKNKYCNSQELGGFNYYATKVIQRAKPYLNRTGLSRLKNKLFNRFQGDILNYSDYDLWIKENESKQDENDLRVQARHFKYNPIVTIILSCFQENDTEILAEVESIRNQIYSNWQLLIVTDDVNFEKIDSLLKKFTSSDSRIKIKNVITKYEDDQLLNKTIDEADGQFIGLIKQGIILSPDALAEIVKLLNKKKNIDFIYSDEDRIDETGTRSEPYFKSDYAPDSLMSSNYIGSFAVIRKNLIQKVGGLRNAFKNAQDYDLYLRIVEQTNKIEHISKVLFHINSNLDPRLDKDLDEAEEMGLEAVRQAAARRNRPAIVTKGTAAGTYKIEYEVVGEPLVSVIVPTKNHGQTLKTCVESVCEQTDYPNFEIIIADNGSSDEETLAIFKELEVRYKNRVKRIVIDIPFNYSRINNLAVKASRGDYLLFLNDDTEVISPEWMRSMLGYAQHEETGAVGAKLLYPDNTVQHSGVVLGIGGVANHIHYHFPKDSSGYFNRLITATNYSCLTAACLMLKKSKFEQINGFDENIAVAFNDVDLCCALTNAGYYGVYDPSAILYHYESKSRGYEDTKEKKERMAGEVEKVQAKWSDLLGNDPMYNKNLSLGHTDYSIKI